LRRSQVRYRGQRRSWEAAPARDPTREEGRMNTTRSGTALGRPAPPEAATPAGRERAGGVEGNARLTGIVAAALFVVLGAEGVTLLGIRQLISVHVFVGMLLGPLVVLKTASTCYRTARYYSGDARYRQKGPPHPILRV